MKNQRREFLKKAGGTLALASVGTSFAGSASAKSVLLKRGLKSQANDKVRIGLIGGGIIGHYDTDAALTIDGVELVAVCDLYTGRLEYAREKYGKDIFTTRDYREVLARPDIDAVLVCTPDHWHQRIAIDAMKAGKHVYCEKPMVQRIEDGQAIIDTQKSTGKVLQVGSQRASSVAVLEAKKVLQSGVIGDLTFVSAYCDRSTAMGAWDYSIPTDASPETVDFDSFLGYAPKIPFDATRFFRWRNYSDYGTGAAGDLIVHLLTTVHTLTDSKGPNKIFSAGDLKYWKDGRDAYDVINALMTYPKTEQHDSFQVTTRVNLCDGEGKGEFGLKLVGTNGVITIGWNDFTVQTLKREAAPGFGGYDSYTSFSAEQKKEFQKWYVATYGSEKGGNFTQNEPTKFEAPEGYDDRVDHMITFFNGVRNGSPILEDAEFGLRAAAPSLACNLSIAQEKPILWDPVGMKLV
ncbi:Gfo/Idh/MocA family oxidoreductase [Algoriphagus terrigena]|uniref:Gfo/Idh/MocA family oxidoreductase n=1 Tax=Algoriphagus terrigena TaxID=344884 RepID=UPI000406061C|nr:Gfo/Idh/MocA family oxidoreductase [Algoriphagus terrigena]